MADISQVKLPSGNTYDIKDAKLRRANRDGLTFDNGLDDPYDVSGELKPLQRIATVTQYTVVDGRLNLIAKINGFIHPSNTTNYDLLFVLNFDGNTFDDSGSWNQIFLTLEDNSEDPSPLQGFLYYGTSEYIMGGMLNFEHEYLFHYTWINSIFVLVGDLSESSEISGLASRISALQNKTIQGVFYAGVLNATSAAGMSDGATTPILTRSDGTTMTFVPSQQTADPANNRYGPGAIVIAPSATAGEPSTEYIWNGSKWQLLGSNTDNFGGFAYANTGTGTYTPGGTVSKPTFSGTPTTITVNGKAANGTASAQTFTGTNATITVKGNKPQQNVNLSISTSSSNNYTPQGTISFDSAVTTASTTITEITGRGTLPSRTASTVVTGVGGGKLVTALSTMNIGKVTGIGSLPTTADKTVVTHTDFGNGYLISGSSTASIPKLTGLGTLPAATSGSVNQVSGLTQQSVSTAKISYMTALDVTGGTASNLTGLGSLISTESKTFATGGTGVSGLGSLISTESKTFATSFATNTTVGSIVTTASKTSAWASVDGETLVLSGSLLNGISTHAFPTLNTGTVRGVSGIGSLISTVALGTSTVRGVTGRGSLPTTQSKSFLTEVKPAATGGFTSSTVVTSITPAHIVSTSSQNVLTNFATGTLPSTTSQTVVTAITAGSTPASTEENIKVLTGVGALPSCASQQVVTSISTANISVSTAQNYSMTGTGALPTTKSTTITYVSNASGNATFTGKPVTISGTVPAATITSTGTYKPEGSNSTSSVSIPAHTSTVAYTPAGTVSQPTFTPATATVTVYPV